jgi:ribosome maturation factor RimP
MSKTIENKIAAFVADGVDATRYELVRVQVTGPTLQLMVERKDGAGMTVDDCATISRAVSSAIEADPELADRYALEVSSPGIDRPLVKLEDYARFQGHVAKIELKAPLEGRRRFQGTIAGIIGDEIEFNVDKDALKVPFRGIERAKLVLTDALLKETSGG